MSYEDKALQPRPPWADGCDHPLDGHTRHGPWCESARLPLPRYQPRPIASCPSCMGDCIDEGLGGFWCPACRQGYTAAQVGYFDEGVMPDD
jgi:hypothetical protein